MDRIDIHIEVPSVSYEEISKPDTPVQDTSSSIRNVSSKPEKFNSNDLKEQASEPTARWVTK